MEHNAEQLKAHILPLSLSTNFDEARREWELVYIEVSEEFDHCPCGKEIKEHCYIRNRMTGAETYVGNVCINRFMGLNASTLFDGLERITKDRRAAPNGALIEHARARRYIYENEYDFLMDTARKRNLSEKQLAWRERINRRIISQVVVKHRGAARPSLTDS